MEDLKLQKLFDTNLNETKYDFEKTNFVLFGAGNLCKKTVEILMRKGIKPIAIADNDNKKHGLKIEDIEIKDIKNIQIEYGNQILIVVSIWVGKLGDDFRIFNIIEELKKIGFTNIIDITKLYKQYPKDFFPHYCLDSIKKILNQKKEILEAYKLFEEDKSKEEYYNQIRWRIASDNWEKFINPDLPAYIQDDIYRIQENDVILDCGAYDGDTIKEIINKTQGKLKQIIAFEPDVENYNKLKKAINSTLENFKDNIKVFNRAVGDKESIVYFNANSDGSSYISEKGSSKVKSVSIDTFFKEENLAIPTVIKMDIEGFEMKALEGAKNIISETSPILLISVYHKQEDLWKIPLFIQSLNQNYKFYLRQHIGDCWDTVLYAIPKERLKNKGVDDDRL